MNEFRRLPWPVFDVGTDLEQTYKLDMNDFQQRNPTDFFFCNLMNIDPLHWRPEHQNDSSEVEQFAPRQFLDPRTGVEIPSHVCSYENVDLKTRNIFLTKYIQVSKLQRHEHSACLNALARLSVPETELSEEEKNDRLLFNSKAILRTEEKKAFLAELREHYFAELHKRFHSVPPSIEYFATQNWKKQLIMMHRQFMKAKFSLKTAILLQPSECVVSTNTVHQERLGCVPQMAGDNLEYVRQSFSNLMNTYNARKPTRQLPAIKEKVKNLVQQHAVDFIIPMSVLKCILSSKTGWTFRMTVKESALSTVFYPKKAIVCEKPLPLPYLSGNDRYKKGAKYLLYSCFHANTSRVYDYNEKTERKISPEAVEGDYNADVTIEYKVANFDEFLRNHARVDHSYGNMTFTIFDVKGHNDSDDTTDSFNILVPTKQATYTKDCNDEIKFINLSPKIEFQAEYGAEMMTKDELISEWCELYFRPNTNTKRVRFDCISGKVIHQQLMTMLDVENELRANYGIEAQQLLQRLWHTLQTFNDFPVGDYLLQSDPKQLNSVKVYEKTESRIESVGISQLIKSGTNAPKLEKNLLDKVEWQPIDDSVILEIHEKCQILPCAFPHSEYLRENNLKPPQGKRKKQTQVASGASNVLKICPMDDRRLIMKRQQLRKMQMDESVKTRDWRKRTAKKARRHARKQQKKVVLNSEMDEFESAKSILAATMDQFTTPSGSSLAETQTTENANSESSSIASRTRRQSKCENSEQPQASTKPFTRQSGRAGTSKTNQSNK